LQGVVAAKIHRLADFGHRVGPRLARFPDAEADQFGAMRLQQIGGPAQQAGALGGRPSMPDLGVVVRVGQGPLDLGR